MDIQRLYSPQTREAMTAVSEDYVSKEVDELALIESLKHEHGLEQVYRFDIGKHIDGFSDLILGVLQESDMAGLSGRNLVEYPDNHYRLLRNRLAEVFSLDPSWIVLSAGLESMIDHISRVFLCPDACFLVPVPNFSVFAAFSSRQGAEPVYVPLRPEDLFQWTDKTVAELKRLIRNRSPKLLWISNPVNPTGQHLPLAWMEELAAAGAAETTAVVVDEAYGEYTDTDQGVVSTSTLLSRYSNLMVLRTFSKIHALPSLRVGYLMCANPKIVEAVTLYRPMFPFSWFSLFVAQIASVDEEHVQGARRVTVRRRKRLSERLSQLPSFFHLPSETNTLMIRHRRMEARDLWQKLAQEGFLTADLSRVNGLQGERFLRMTVCREAENDLFVDACRRIEETS